MPKPISSQPFAVGGDAGDAVVGEHAAAVGQVQHALEQAVGDDRLEGVQLQLAGFGGKGDGHVVADDFEGDLIDHFRDHRIDLAGHDRRAGLTRRQVDFAEAGARTGRQQAQIVAGLGELDRDALEHAGELHEAAAILRRLDQVGASRGKSQAGKLTDTTINLDGSRPKS